MKLPTIHLTAPAHESTLIVACGYDAATRIMALKFSGKDQPYFYADVPPAVYAGVRSSFSPGRFYGANIKGKFKAPETDDDKP